MLNGFLGLPIERETERERERERETETETEKKGGSPLSALNPECVFSKQVGDLRGERERERENKL